MSDDDRTVISLARGGAGGKYWAIATWDGRCWQVRIEDYDEAHRADTAADRLADVGTNACAALAAIFGCHPDQLEVSVEARLPATVLASLRTAEGLVAQATPHVQSAVIGLHHANMPGPDVATILAARPPDRHSRAATCVTTAEDRPPAGDPADPLSPRPVDNRRPVDGRRDVDRANGGGPSLGRTAPDDRSALAARDRPPVSSTLRRRDVHPRDQRSGMS